MTFRSACQAFGRDLFDGARLAMLRAPRAPADRRDLEALLPLIAVVLLVPFGFDFAAQGGAGQFNVWGLPLATFFVALALAAAAIYATLATEAERVPAILIALIGLWAVVQAFALGTDALLHALAPPRIAWRISGWLDYAVAAWVAVAATVAAARIGPIHGALRRLAALAIGAVLGVGLHGAVRMDSLWTPDYSGDDTAPAARMGPATEAAFYAQPVVLERELGAVQPGRKDTVDLYFVGAAGYASQDVFMREVRAAATLFAERFDTTGRSVSLINNGAAVMESPVASLTSLRRALAQVGKAMQPEEDVLFLFITSHGSKSHEISLSFWPMRFDALGPAQLKAALDESGIKWRVIVVSACYSGGFVEPLADAHTIVITAAAADRTSFGCSNEAQFTYFGKAYFDQALRETRSFVKAYERARDLVTARELSEGHEPSNPQLNAGAAIVAHLEALEARLERDATAATVATARPDAAPGEATPSSR